MRCSPQIELCKLASVVVLGLEMSSMTNFESLALALKVKSLALALSVKSLVNSSRHLSAT